jgi:histidyl-tRNA synthetase
MNIPFEIDPRIVRGLDYYNRTVFEFVSCDLGAQSTVCGGGRYDGLVSSLGGPELPGVGFAMGITRIILAMRDAGVADITAKAPRLYIASLGEAAMISGLEITERLRRAGVYAECDTMARSLKAQMKYANKIGAEYTLIIGESEILAGRAQLRNMKTGEQSEVELQSFTI